MSKIPIRNIYVMLAYASRDAGLLDDRSIGACDFERPLDLVARLLDASMRRLRRRGLERTFVPLDEQGARPRGAIAITPTITQLLPARGELAWTVDEFLPDTPANQVLKAALRGLLVDEVGAEVRGRLRAHLAWLAGIRDIPARKAILVRARVPRAIPEYRGALQLARLVLEHLLPDLGQAGARWQALLHDPERMGELFEKFVRGFAAFEFSGEARVGARRFEWGVGDGSDSDTGMLPAMQTDVFLQWRAGAVTVCECKFYEAPLVQQPWGEVERLRSGHLYQLMAYLRATERVFGVRPAGLLLYARSGKAFGGQWVLEGYRLRVASVDLGDEWSGIREALRDVLVSAGRSRPAGPGA